MESTPIQSQYPTPKPVCQICGHELYFVGNEEYAEDGNQYNYRCPNCGADIEVYEPLDDVKQTYTYWQERYEHTDKHD